MVKVLPSGEAGVIEVGASILVPVMLKLGYDTITATAVALCGTISGYIGAMANPFTVGIAQEIAGLPRFSEMGYRFVVFCIIAVIGPNLACDDAKVIDATDMLIMPGLCNAHLHSDENIFKGMTDNLPLELWMLYTYPTLKYGPFSERFIYLRTMLGAIEMLKSGVTLAQDDASEYPASTLPGIDAVMNAYLAPGMRADLVMLDTLTTAFTPLSDLINHLVYCENGSSIRTVMVNGRVVVEDGRVLTVDEKAILEELRTCLPDFWKRYEETRAWADKLFPYVDQVYQRAVRQDIGVNRWSGDQRLWTE